MWRIDKFILVICSPSIHIYIWSDQRCIFDEVVHPVINGEVKGGEPNVGTFVVPNVYTSQESMVLTQKVEEGYEYLNVVNIILLYEPPPPVAPQLLHSL